MDKQTEDTLGHLQDMASESIKEAGAILPSLFFLTDDDKFGQANIEHLMENQEYLHQAINELRSQMKTVFLLLEVSILRDGAPDIDCAIQDHPHAERALMLTMYDGLHIKMWNATVDDIGSECILGEWNESEPINGLLFQNPPSWN